MRVASIGLGKTLAVPYDLYGAYNVVTIRVRGRVAAAVDVFLVDEHGFAQFQQGVAFPSWIGATGRFDHHLSKVVPPGRWYLLIRNPTRHRAITVDYELSAAPWTPPPTPTGMTGSFG